MGAAFRVFFDVLVLYLFYRFAVQYKVIFLEMVRTRYFPLGSFILFTIFIVLLPLLMDWYSGGAKEPNRPGVSALSICMMLPIFYLSLMCFSTAVFSYIPASRGGGDYTVAPIIVIKVKSGLTVDSANARYLEADGQGGLRTHPSVLIEETSAAIFIADPNDAGGPAEWRKSQGTRPGVFAIARQNVEAVQYLSPEDIKRLRTDRTTGEGKINAAMGK